MKNAFLRYSSICVSLMFAGALATTTASATIRDLATVTFAQPVTVGSTTLPAGHYTIADEGDDAFLVQSDNGEQSAVVLGRRVDNSAAAANTKVVLAPNSEGMALDKLVIGGDSAAYQFVH